MPMADLETWLHEAVGDLDVDASLLTPEAVTILLDLARDAAHNVARPAAPLATFAAGLALGQAVARDRLRLEAEAARISAASEAWRKAHPEDEPAK